MNSQQSSPNPNGAVPAALLAGMAGVLALPALAGGIAIAQALRHRSLKWTWAALALFPAALAALVLVPLTLDRVNTMQLAHRPVVELASVWVWVLWPTWLVLTPLVVLWWQLRCDRHDRLHGGTDEQRLALRRGPLDAWRQHTAHHTPTAPTRAGRTAGRLNNVLPAQLRPTPPPPVGSAVWLGVDERGRQVHSPLLEAHCTIVGGSNSGKTNTTMVLLSEHVQAGFGFIVLDGKGGRDLPRLAAKLGKAYNRPVALWNLRAYGDPALDALRRPWNPMEGGDPVAVKDRISATEEQTEPYYRTIADNGVQLAARVLRARGEEVSMRSLSRMLTMPKDLAADVLGLAEELADDEEGRADARLQAAWLRSLDDQELSGLRGMGVRLRIMVDSDPDRMLAPGSETLSLHTALKDGWLVVFTLPEGDLPAIVPHVAAYAIQTVNAACTRLEGLGERARSLLVVDELSAFRGDQLASTFERTRSAGVRVIAATQSISNFKTVGGDKLMDSARDNNELLIVHRQATPENAEMIASMIGTEEAWEHTHKVSGGAGALGIRLGHDEPGERARRLTDRFIVHPNTIKTLPQGHAIVVRRHPENTVQQVGVRAAQS